MTSVALIQPDVTDMPGACGLPRSSGELVFHSEWERRAFAMAVSLAEQGRFEWREFQQLLAEQIDPSRDYYESWLAALEALLRRKQLLVVSR